MTFNRGRPHMLTLSVAVALLSMASAHDPVQRPANAIDSPEVARELCVTAQRFLDAIDLDVKARREERDAVLWPCSVSMITGARDPRRTAPSITTEDDHPFNSASTTINSGQVLMMWRRPE